MTVNINAANISAVKLVDQAGTPATPPAGSRLLYGKSTGLYLVDSSGNVEGPIKAGRVLISEQTPTGTGTVTWSSIPATYKSLFIEIIARGTQAATGIDILCYFNNDTTATNYRYTYHINTGAQTQGEGDGANCASVAAGTAPAGSCGIATIYIPGYAGTTFNKQARGNSQYRSAAADEQINDLSIEWENTAAINRIDLVTSAGNYDTGSVLRLYGVF